MSADSQSYALNISEHLFALTTESLRLWSNETRRHQTLSRLVDDRISTSRFENFCNPEITRRHLDAVATSGNIRINLTVSKTSAANLAEFRKWLEQQLGSETSWGDAVSVLLFDYVAEQKALRVLRRIGMDERNDPSSGTECQSSDGVLVPFR